MSGKISSDSIDETQSKKNIRDKIKDRIKQYKTLELIHMKKSFFLFSTISGVLGLALPIEAMAQSAISLPSVNISMAGGNAADSVAAIKILLMLTILSLAPAILIMMTSFTRIVVVLSFLRQALSTQQMPPNQLIIGLSLFLSFFVMAPTFNKIYDNAVVPYMDEKITQLDAIKAAETPLRTFMFFTDPAKGSAFIFRAFSYRQT